MEDDIFPNLKSLGLYAQDGWLAIYPSANIYVESNRIYPTPRSDGAIAIGVIPQRDNNREERANVLTLMGQGAALVTCQDKTDYQRSQLERRMGSR